MGHKNLTLKIKQKDVSSEIEMSEGDQLVIMTASWKE